MPRFRVGCAGGINEGVRNFRDEAAETAQQSWRRTRKPRCPNWARAARGGRAGRSLKALQDPALKDETAVRFWRAQALASLQRWNEALPLYQQVSGERTSPLRAAALFAQAEALRALQRFDEALRFLAALFAEPQWSDRAQLRSIELLLDRRDNPGARRLLDKARPAALGDKKEKRYLQGRLQAQLDNHERALELYQTVVRRTEGVSRPVFIATLCAIAESHLQLRRPAAGDDALENFVEHYPTDPELPTIFAKLDQLYRAERQFSNQELSRWANDSIQPRRSRAQWYLARSELRAGAAMERGALQRLREDHAKCRRWPKVFEFAQGMEDRGSMRRRHPERAGRFSRRRVWLDEIALLAGRAHYQAKHFETAAQMSKRSHTRRRVGTAILSLMPRGLAPAERQCTYLGRYVRS